MNSYGDRAQGRGRAGGDHDLYDGRDSYSAYADEYASESYGVDPYPADPYQVDSYRADVPRSASPARPVARAAVRVPPQAESGTGRPRYDWSAAASGRATVPVSPGPSSGGPARGRASVPPPGSGGGPGGPSGPGDRRPPGRKKKKRHWIRNTLLSLIAIIVMIAGGGMVALSWYVDSVPPPQDIHLPQASTVYYADGEEEMAVLQDVNREIIDTKVDALENARLAVVAAEDKDFYNHKGVDFIGIVRAAWNNFTGGERQGASTIDQQYTRAADELHEDTYLRKLEEAAKAYKLNQEVDKATILDYYLNTIYFGRGAHGIQAAADAYFGKGADELTLAEAAVLAGVIRLPDSGNGMSPYDPLYDPDDTSIAEARFRYVLTQLVDMGVITPEESAAMELPEAIDPQQAQDWHTGPHGPIVRQVRWELEAMGITDLNTGGYRITTTIDPDIQDAALAAARRKSGGPIWEGEQGYRTPEENVDAALVAIDPRSGAVRGYYGGDDGTGFDTAGKNWRGDTEEWYGGRPPGSTFKIYTLVAALREGVSFDSRWQAGDYTDSAGHQVRNAGRTPQQSGCAEPDYCTLRWATEQSFNTPFYHFSEGMSNSGKNGPASIVQAATDAGITLMTDTRTGDAHDLTEQDAAAVAPEYFYHHVAFGQYPVTVMDHASGVATLANKGVYHKPYFVEKVERRDQHGEWETVRSAQIAGDSRIEEPIAVAVTEVLSRIPQINNVPLANGRPAAAKTGTWEYTPSDPNDHERGNADAWVVGYTPQLAAAVWVGDAERSSPIKYTDGGTILSSQLPAHIWKQFMDEAHSVKEYPPEQFPPARPIGNVQHPLANGIEPEPEDDDEDEDCRFGIFCRDDDDDDDDDNRGRGPGDNNGEGGGGNGGGASPLPDRLQLPQPTTGPDPDPITQARTRDDP